MWEQIRKFGLGHCDLTTLLWNVSVLLRVLTLNIDSNYKRRIPIVWYIFTVVISVCYFYVYLVSMVWFVFVRSPETGDIISAIIIFSLGIASEIGTIKLFYMFLYKDKIKQIVDGCRECDAEVLHGSRFYNNLLVVLKNVKKRALIFWIIIISNGVLYIMKPIILPGRHLMEDSYIIYGLEPIFESPNYEIAFLCMFGGVVFTCYLPANITAFLIVAVGYTEAQMLALSKELVCLWDDAKKYQGKSDHANTENTTALLNYDVNRSKIINEYINQRLKKIIKCHTRNINLIYQVEDVFRGAIAVEFALLIVGLIAELLGGLENTYMEIPYALMQVGMDCLTGQRVIDASVTFENAVYDCKWENFDKSNMKMVLLILQNAQKTMKLSAGGITMLSFTCFMSVIKSIYSTYTTLRSTMH